MLLKLSQRCAFLTRITLSVILPSPRHLILIIISSTLLIPAVLLSLATVPVASKAHSERGSVRNPGGSYRSLIGTLKPSSVAPLYWKRLESRSIQNSRVLPMTLKLHRDENVIRPFVTERSSDAKMNAVLGRAFGTSKRHSNSLYSADRTTHILVEVLPSKGNITFAKENVASFSNKFTRNISRAAKFNPVSREQLTRKRISRRSIIKYSKENLGKVGNNETVSISTMDIPFDIDTLSNSAYKNEINPLRTTFRPELTNASSFDRSESSSKFEFHPRANFSPDLTNASWLDRSESSSMFEFLPTPSFLKGKRENNSAAHLTTTTESSNDNNFMDNGNDSLSIGRCSDWTGGQHSMFQVGNLLYLVAFLVPHSFKSSSLMIRCLLVVALTLFCAWAAFHLCALDVFLWNFALFLVNFIHVMRLGYVLWPTRLRPELRDLYDKLFRPLKVGRMPFVHLARVGEIEQLSAGQVYAEEENTPAAMRLAILLSGRLSVSCDCTHLHYIFPNQFVDSPEWEASSKEEQPTEKFQVTVVAEEDSALLVWQRDTLVELMADKRSVGPVLHSLIGKDITTKLYSLTEQHFQQQALESKKRHAAPLLLPGDREVPWRTLSMDAMHTGSRGLVRSTGWRARQRQAAVTHLSNLGFNARVKKVGCSSSPDSDNRAGNYGLSHAFRRQGDAPSTSKEDPPTEDRVQHLTSDDITRGIGYFSDYDFRRSFSYDDRVDKEGRSQDEIDLAQFDGTNSRSSARFVSDDTAVSNASLNLSASNFSTENSPHDSFSHDVSSTMNLLDDPNLVETAV